MKISLRDQKRVLAVALAMMTGACSKVSFTPMESTEGRRNIPLQSVSETFNFNDDENAAKVDVLFIVDNSGSMREEQAKLAPRLASFLGSLGQVDWQIGITTTDTTSSNSFGLKGRLDTWKGTSSKILTKFTPNYLNVFANTVERSESIGCGAICPSDDERALEATMMAINRHNTDNAGFFRPGANLAVVILSDEDEQSDGPSGATTGEDVIEAFTNVFADSRKITGYGIIIKPGDTDCENEQSVTSGRAATFADHFVTLTGGSTGSICETDYASTLTKIGQEVRENTRTKITLAFEPATQGFSLSILPEDSTLKWSVEGQSVVFEKMPKKGTTIKITYFEKDKKESQDSNQISVE